MNRILATALTTAAVLVTTGAAGTAIHHGWANYDTQRVLNMTGTVREVKFGSPHVVIQFQPSGDRARRWEAILAPPSRMERRGLPKSRLTVGTTARLVGYPHRKNAGELRAERIIIGTDTTELR